MGDLFDRDDLDALDSVQHVHDVRPVPDHLVPAWHPDKEACRTVEVDGEPVRVRGDRPMDDTDKAAFTQVVRAATKQFEDHLAALGPQMFALVNQQCGHVGGYSDAKYILMAYKTRLLIYGYKGWTVEARHDTTDAELLALVEGERCDVCRFRKGLLR